MEGALMIATERLDLRRIEPADSGLILALFSDPEVSRWVPTPQPITSKAAADERTAYLVTRGGHLEWAGIYVVRERDSGVDVGITLVVPLPLSSGEAPTDVEIGWHFLPSAWGNGYATESGQAMVEHGFAHGIESLYAVTHPDNARSQAVCRRLGMADIGLTDRWHSQPLRAFRLDQDRRSNATS